MPLAGAIHLICCGSITTYDRWPNVAVHPTTDIDERPYRMSKRAIFRRKHPQQFSQGVREPFVHPRGAYTAHAYLERYLQRGAMFTASSSATHSRSVFSTRSHVASWRRSFAHCVVKAIGVPRTSWVAPLPLPF